MILFSQAGHWYTPGGDSAHDADLRAARKQGLFRSITSIDKEEFKNPALERYILEQYGKAAFDNPRQPHETLDDYDARIYELSLEHSGKAAKFGIELHDCIDKLPAEPSAEMKPFVDPVAKWLEENIIETIAREKVVLDHDIGVAGRMDRRVIHKVHGPLVIDFKTQGVKKDKKTGKPKPGFYDSFPRQLAFYAAAEAKNEGTYPRFDRGLSLVIDSTEPSPPYERLWEREELVAAYEDFVIAAYRYYKKKDYWPIGRWNLCDKLNAIVL